MKNIKLLYSYTKGQRLNLILAIISAALSTYFMIQVPFIIRFTIDSIIGNKLADTSPYIIQFILMFGDIEFYRKYYLYIALAIIFLAVLRGLFLFGKAKFSATAGNAVAKMLREKMYQHIQALSYDYHIKVNTGDLLQRCTSDIDTIRRFIELQFVEIGSIVFLLSMVIGSMIAIHPLMTLISTFVFPLIIVLSIRFFRRINKVFTLVDKQEAKLSTIIQENLSGVRVVRAFGRQSYEIDRFNIENEIFSEQIYKLIMEYGRFWPTQDIIVLTQRCIAVVVGIYFTINGTITLGTFIAFTTLLNYIIWPLRTFGRIISELSKSLVSCDRIQEVLSESTEYNAEDVICDLNGDIVFEDLSFCYEQSGRKVLENINLRVKRGETLAILGATGAGKSTLMHLLVRFYDPSKGRITVNGFDIKKVNKHHLRKHIALVLQEPFLFAKSVSDNIKISMPQASTQMIEEAARISDIHNNIIDFDRGYDTMVGEKGVSLSGGQKQRVSIARKVITGAPVLIFDDSLSAVDTETDAAIRRRLKEVHKDHTTIVISHRIATLSEADHIIVIDQGRIVEEGDHQSLLKFGGLYYKAWKIQGAQEMAM